MPERVRQKMESYFRTSFAEVRVHVGPQAAALGALAYTQGSNLYFAPGRYDPATPQGQQLLGHELAHVVQQRAGRVRNPFLSGVALVVDREMESEADRMGLGAATHRETFAPRPEPAVASRAKAAASVQPLSFARFSRWGLLSNWGSYTTAETNLRALEAQVYRFYLGLSRSTKSRGAVQTLKSQLDAIHDSTIGTDKYAATAKKLGKIEKQLEQERRRQVLRERGYPENPVLDNVYSGGIDDQAWNRIVYGIPKEQRRLLRLGKRPDGLVQALFNSFCGQGFQYHTQMGGAGGLMGSHRGPTPEGNCIALARGFKDVLNAYEIEAEVEEVRTMQQGRFIVKLKRFIDSRVRGHIYYKKTLQPFYFMFMNHAATWVPSLNVFFDPMAMTKYSSLEPHIDCNITEVEAGVFVPKKRPKTLCPDFGWKLVDTKQAMDGAFYKLNLLPR